MQPLSIPCPACGQKLRLRDRSRLGKRGKCPKCEHKFVLNDPGETADQVRMELADSAPAASRPAKQPAMGTSARWIPDEQAAAPIPALPTIPQVGEQSASPQAAPRQSGAVQTPILQVGESDNAGVSQMQRIRRRSSKGTKLGIAIGAVTAVLVTLAVVIANRGTDEVAPPRPRRNQALVAEKKDLKEQLAIADKQSPTQGEPIKLMYVPAGARIIFNLHPAELWKPTSPGEEVLACLGGGFKSWAEATLKEICRHEPAQIEEALICLIPRQRGTPPDIAAVVHLAEEPKRSDLLLAFGAERDDSHGHPVYKNETYVFNIIDPKTFAVGPRDLAQEMVDGMKFPQVTDPDISQLIVDTDRERHFTVLFEPHDLRIYQDVLVPDEVRPFLNQFINWFGEDVTTVAWSLHLGREKFHSEMLLRNGPGSVASPRRIYREFDKKLDELPQQVLTAVSKMKPQRLGFRKIIGRVPAMLFGYSLATTGGIGDRHVQLTTVLPERAAPNLAAGAMLTWAESLRTDFTKDAPDLSQPKLPDLLADRLKTEIDVDFRATPLANAFAYIGSQTSVKFDVNGDALKNSGMTQNMTQTYNLGMAPAIDAIQTILNAYQKEGLCVTVDETAKLATVTTLKAVEAGGIKESPTLTILRPRSE